MKQSPWQSQQSLLRMYDDEDSPRFEASAGHLHGMIVRERKRQKVAQKTRGRKQPAGISARDQDDSEHEWTHGEFDPLTLQDESLSKSQKRKRMFSQQEIVYQSHKYKISKEKHSER